MIRRLFELGRRHRVAVGYILLCMAMALIYSDLRHQADEGAQTHKAVCEFRGDLHRRINASEDFLKTHPQGAFGVTAKVIEAQITQQRKTINALEALECP
jgi:hypothetical protein